MEKRTDREVAGEVREPESFAEAREKERGGRAPELLQGVPLKFTPHKFSKSPALYEI